MFSEFDCILKMTYSCYFGILQVVVRIVEWLKEVFPVMIEVPLWINWWNWVTADNCVRGTLIILKTYFTVRSSSFNMALSFSKNDARIEIWFSRDRRASRERLAAWLFFRR